MKSQARDPAAYLSEVDPARRVQLQRLRALVRHAVPEAEEKMQSGMLTYTFEGRPFASVAAQKDTLSLYLMDLYTQPELREQHAKALAGLKMGKNCINFDRVDELPLETIRAILAEAPYLTVDRGTLAPKVVSRDAARPKPAPPPKPEKEVPKLDAETIARAKANMKAHHDKVK